MDFEITTKIFIYKFISISILFYIDDVTRLRGKLLNDTSSTVNRLKIYLLIKCLLNVFVIVCYDIPGFFAESLI